MPDPETLAASVDGGGRLSHDRNAPRPGNALDGADPRPRRRGSGRRLSGIWGRPAPVRPARHSSRTVGFVGFVAVLGKRRRERARERGRRMGAAVAAYMDRLEARSWEWRKIVEQSGKEAANETFGYAGKTEAEIVADVVQDLLGLCEGNIEYVMDAVQAWSDRYDARFNGNQAEAEDRGPHAMGVLMSIQLTGIGNLFGFIPNEAPMHDPELAAEGRRRGWGR